MLILEFINLNPGRNVNQKIAINFIAENEHCLYFIIIKYVPIRNKLSHLHFRIYVF